MKKAVMFLTLPALLMADFRYESTTRITKGMASKLTFGKKQEPVKTTHYYKGGRIATVSTDSTTIIDFDKQLFTNLNHKDRQYWQLTFDEMRQRMAEAQEEVKNNTKDQDAQLDIRFDVKATGVQKEVGGYPAKEVLFTIEIGATDGKNSGTALLMKNDSWHSEAVTGYGEYKAFLARLSDKRSFLSLGQMQSAMAGQRGMAEGMRKMTEEMQKTPGIPVLTISRVTMPGVQMPSLSSANGGNTDGNGGTNGNAPTAGDAVKQAGGQAAGNAAGRALGGSMGGMLGGALGGKMGGFGGFGKKKTDAAAQAEADAKAKADADAAAQAEQARKTATEAAAASKSPDGMLMMESVTDASNFSTAAIEESIFQVPAGYAKMDSDFGGKRKKK